MKKCTVVGQGLAGTVLAFLLQRAGWQVTVADRGHEGSASAVAAGMWNPVSFRRVSAEPLLLSCLPHMAGVYRAMEAWLDERFFFPTPLVRIFPDQQSANLWDEKTRRPLLAPLVRAESPSPSPHFNAPYGTGCVADAGWLDVPKMLAAARAAWMAAGTLNVESWSPGHCAEVTLWCTGAAWHAEGPAWRHAVIPNKGQLLQVEMDGTPIEGLVHFGNFLVPSGSSGYVTGATYERTFDHPQPTPEARALLHTALKEVYSGGFAITGQTAGIRPTTRDRQPLVGPLEGWPNQYLFNGFGSRGVLLVPWCAARMVEHLETGSALPRAVSTTRLSARPHGGVK